jgi:quercetin dioxygenase-like cupin family protein
MNQKRVLCWSSALLVLAVSAARAGSPPPEEGESAPPGLKLETLLSAPLEGASGVEVIVSRVILPPNTSLPKHWHPGEEFAYVLEGTVTLWQEGKPDTQATAGDVIMVPLHQVHTAITGDEGAAVLVFRVHEQGQPERVPVDCHKAPVAGGAGIGRRHEAIIAIVEGGGDGVMDNV